jgi:hypothetical protein
MAGIYPEWTASWEQGARQDHSENRHSASYSVSDAPRTDPEEDERLEGQLFRGKNLRDFWTRNQVTCPRKKSNFMYNLLLVCWRQKRVFGLFA